MKTSPVTVQDLQRSVIAVPPLARHADLSLNEGANQKLLRHLEAVSYTHLDVYKRQGLPPALGLRYRARKSSSSSSSKGGR